MRRRSVVRFLPGLFGILMLAACALAPAGSGTAYVVERDLRYTPADVAAPQLADLYRPRNAGGGPRPAIVVVHGGGWIQGDRAQMKHLAEALAGHGYVVLNIDYRLAPQHPYPAAVDDVRSALRWLRDHAARLDVDSGRLGLWGYSAGAQLAGLVAARPASGTPMVAAAVLGGIPADLARARDSELVQKFMGGPYEQQPQRYAEASPLQQINGASAPMFLYHGRWDWIVDPRYSQLMYQGLRAAGVDAELCELGGRGHFTAFFFDGRAIAGGLAFLDRHFAAAVGAAAR